LKVAYFSPEFGVAERLPQYSGGLGVLAGDHLKAAADLGVPLVGVGLFYRHGYFHQELDDSGWQHEQYPDLDADAIGMSPVEGEVGLDLAGTMVTARPWRFDVGSVPLYLLEADGVTDRLYGGDAEHRLCQELVLGIGGVRLLRRLGLAPTVFHSNEGHAGFLGLERIRETIVGQGLSFGDAVEHVRAANLFTTHTPVPAGIDRFPRELIQRYFGAWCDGCGVSVDDLMALGHAEGEPPDAPFNMAMLGLRLSARANAVSKLHAEVSTRMFGVPIEPVTNGVHVPTWAAAPPAEVATLSNEDLWQHRAELRRAAIELARERAGAQLDPDVLTIGFARRFAAYKRGALLLSQPERLLALLDAPDRRLQLVFAGKAHPADHLGKELIQRVVQFSRRPEVAGRIAFVPDYDLAVARCLVQGCDVWLNTPRRPLEACGTSGMKAALNGGLNCSVLDGWWDELYDGDNGWAIPSAEDVADEAERDHIEADALFGLLEKEIVPLFYDDRPGWLRKVRHSLGTLAPAVDAERMVREYVEKYYDT